MEFFCVLGGQSHTLIWQMIKSHADSEASHSKTMYSFPPPELHSTPSLSKAWWEITWLIGPPTFRGHHDRIARPLLHPINQKVVSQEKEPMSSPQALHHVLLVPVRCCVSHSTTKATITFMCDDLTPTYQLPGDTTIWKLLSSITAYSQEIYIQWK